MHPRAGVRPQLWKQKRAEACNPYPFLFGSLVRLYGFLPGAFVTGGTASISFGTGITVRIITGVPPW